jgi:hypothetical protein
MRALDAVGAANCRLYYGHQSCGNFHRFPRFVEELRQGVAGHLFLCSRLIERKISLPATEDDPGFHPIATTGFGRLVSCD